MSLRDWSLLIALSILWGGSFFFVRVALDGVPPLTLVLARVAIAAAVLSTALAYIIFFRILASAGPSNLLLVTFLIPVSAILLASLILGERLAWTHFAGMGLIGLGLAAIDGRVWRAMRG